MTRSWTSFRFSAAAFRGLILAFALLGATAARAQIVFTFDATATAPNLQGYDNGDEHGYTVGDTYTFSFTINPAITEANLNGNSFFASWGSCWTVENYNAVSTTLFSAVSGSGLSGTYVPGPGTGSPEGLITRESFSQWSGTGAQLSLAAYANDGITAGDAGIRTLDGHPIIFAMANVQVDVPVFALNQNSYSSPNTFLSEYLGQEYAATGAVDLFGQPDHLQFVITKLSVSEASAVPEPATYASLAGIAALGVVALRRRRRAEAVKV